MKRVILLAVLVATTAQAQPPETVHQRYVQMITVAYDNLTDKMKSDDRMDGFRAEPVGEFGSSIQLG
jgi:hypothetical protein